MNMSVLDVLELFCFPDDQRFILFDFGEEEEVFDGYIGECPDEFLEMEVQCIDNIYRDNSDGYIIINIDSKSEF